MFVKVHNPKDLISSNKGSCRSLAQYLCKEGDIMEGFFAQEDGDSFGMDSVIYSIDSNRSKLSKSESKFFMLTINPTHQELCSLIGREVKNQDELTPAERGILTQKLEEYTRTCMNEYALGFERDSIKSGDDLLYYGRVETERRYKFSDSEVVCGKAKVGELKEGLNWHTHVIVSRKSRDGKLRLSPCADSKGNTWLNGNGEERRRGFNHLAWKQRCITLFKEQYGIVEQANGEEKVLPVDNKQEERNFALFEIKNKDLSDTLSTYSFTSIQQIRLKMEDLGYSYTFSYGQHIFEKDGEQVSLDTKTLKLFEAPLSETTKDSILERFNPFLFSSKDNKVGEGLSLVHLESTIKGNDGEEKAIITPTLYDVKTKTYLKLSELSYYKSKIRDKVDNYISSLENKDLQTALRIKKTPKVIQEYMTEKGYTCTYDEKKQLYSFEKEGEKYDIHKSAMFHINKCSLTRKEMTLNIIAKKSPEIHNLLVSNNYTSFLQIKEDIKDLGYEVRFEEGRYIFSATDKANVQLATSQLKLFEQKMLPKETMFDICSRMNTLNITSGNIENLGEGLSLKTYQNKFSTEDEKDLVHTYSVVYDSKTNTRINLQRVLSFQRDNMYNKGELCSIGKDIDTEIQRALFHSKSQKHFINEMKKNGYDVTYNDKTNCFDYTNGDKIGSIHKEVVNNFSVLNRVPKNRASNSRVQNFFINKGKIEGLNFFKRKLNEMNGFEEKEMQTTKSLAKTSYRAIKSISLGDPKSAAFKVLKMAVQNLLDVKSL